MNPKLPRIYTLTVGRGPNHQHVSDQSRPAFVQSHSQSQAVLTYAQHVFRRGSSSSGAYIARPTFPYYVQFMVLFRNTQPLLTTLVHRCVAPTINWLSTRSIWPRSPTRLRHTAVRPGPTQHIQPWSLRPFCCF